MFFPSVRKGRRVRLGLENLEGRDVPAIDITAVELADSEDTLIDPTIVPLFVGEQIFLRVTYTVTDLPSNAEYGLSVYLDSNPVAGASRTITASGITLGAGISGTSTHTINTAAIFNRNTWYAQGGNDFQIDMFSQVGFNSSDTELAFFNADFPTISELPFSLNSPIAGAQNKNWVLANNLDQDPEFTFIGTDGIMDFRGGTSTTDGQKTIDYQLADYSASDAGVSVLAAAAGRVLETQFGEYDRNYDLTRPYQLSNEEFGNFVVIDHDNGWFTRYSGLRDNSLRVQPGDKVTPGQILGLVGGSGIPAQGPRLGFTFFYDRGAGATSIVDPFVGGYFAAGVEPNDQSLTPVSLNAGVTNYDFTTDTTALAERPTPVGTFLPGQTVYFWSSGTQVIGSNLAITFYDPSGAAVRTVSSTATDNWARTTASYDLPSVAANGNWRAVMTVSGVQVAQQTFAVSNSASVPTIYVKAVQPIGPPVGPFYAVPGRTAPLNIGTSDGGEFSSQATLKVTNIGTGPLLLSAPITTTGIRFFSYPTGPIAPGETVEFGVGFDGTIDGKHTGQYRIPTNDPLTPFFDGVVTGNSRIAGSGGVDSGVVVGDTNTANNPLLGTLDGLRIRTTPSTPGLAPGAATAITDNSFSVSTDAGVEGQVVVYAQNGSERFRITPFPGFTGGIRTATGDFDNDGVADLVIGSGPGMATKVLIYNGRTNRPIFETQPFEESFTGGVYVTTGDFNADGIPELVVTPDQGGGPRVRILDGQLASQNKLGIVLDFFGIADPNFRGGARAAVGDINGDGKPDLIVAAGFGGGPRIAVYDGNTVTTRTPMRLFSDFFAFELGLRNGVFVTAGDVNADGKGDLIVGGGPGGAPRIAVFSGAQLMQNQQVQLANFFAGDEDSRGGVRLAVRDLYNDGTQDLIAGAGSGKFSQLLSYPLNQLSSATPIPTLNLSVFPDFTGGVFVG
jgi:hypothetical protein